MQTMTAADPRPAAPEGMAPVVSVDLGGTRTRASLVDPTGRVLSHDVAPTDHAEPYPRTLLAMIRQTAEGSGAVSAVVGVPGRVDHANGRLEFAPNLPPHWAEHLTQARLSRDTGLEVSLANDADLAAVGEFRFGAGRGAHDLVYLTMSTGVGCGVIVDGHLLHGRRSLAEAGHATIDMHAAEGHRTLEQAASGTAMNRLAEDAGLDARGADLVTLVRAGDARALAVWDELTLAAGFGVAGLAHLFSPQRIVVGGGLGLTGDLLYDPMRVALAAYGPRELPEPIPVVGAELGDDSGIVGAAGWAHTFIPVQTA